MIKKNQTSFLLWSAFVALMSFSASAATIFTDNFSNGSTTNALSLPGGTTTASFTSYDIASTKNALQCSIAPNWLRGRLNATTTSGFWEMQALFATGNSVVTLAAPGDYVDISIVFTNSQGTLLLNTDEVWVGLFNSGSSPTLTNFPVSGALANSGLTTTAGSVFATGNCQLWTGYAVRFIGATAGNWGRIQVRPPQTGAGTTSANQELFGSNVGGGAYNNPTASSTVNGPASVFTLNNSSAYTLLQRIMVNPDGSGSMVVSCALATGSLEDEDLAVFYSFSTTNSSAIINSFDGFSFGALNKSDSANPLMDVRSITITGQVSPPVAPVITSQPVSAEVAFLGSGAFMVSATGNGLTYQWKRNGTNLVNGGNIAGATTPMLVISQANSSDALSGANGYYVVVTGAGGLSTTSVTNALTLRPATNLVYSGTGAWDIASSPSWQNEIGVTGLLFHYGDAVTFNDVGGGGTVTLNGPFLSASSVTVDHTSSFYTFSGSGSFAGPGSLIYKGSAQLTINNANTYTGGTIISNVSANLRVNNANALGSGAVTMAKAGGKMTVLNTSSSIPGLVVADDGEIVIEPIDTSFGLLVNGNLSGTSGKTLTINHGTLGAGTTQTRVRAFGTSTVYDGNINLNGTDFIWAFYHPSGSQTYNGVFSGGGLLMSKESTTYLNGANTHSGGTQPAAGSIGLGRDSVGIPVTSGPLGTGPLLLKNDSGTSLGGSGTIFAWGGPRVIGNPIQYATGSNNLTLVIGGTNNLTLTGPFSLNGNDGLGAGTNRTIQVDNTALSTLSGVISDSGLGVGLIKTGTGLLVLGNAETYTGPTAVNAGTLRVDGSLAAGSAVTVATNATLAGAGSVGGNVTVNAGGRLSPGASIGTLGIGGNLAMAGHMGIEVNRLASPNSDRVSVTGTINNSGSGIITVTNVGSALQAGDTFALFNKAVPGGNLMTITGGDAVWTNKLATDGTIQVLTPISSTPTNISFSVSGGNMTLSWPMSHITWTLQSNSVGVATSAWYPVPGSQNTTQVIVPIDPLKTNVFFRLVK